MFEHHLSGEAFERLHAWCLAKCPALDDEFLAGLMAIVEEEVRAELAKVCWRRLRLLAAPCRQCPAAKKGG